LVNVQWKVLVLVLVLAIPVAGAPAVKPPAATPAQAASGIMPLSQVKPGMRGIGKTVISGQKVEEFQFEVMDILQSGGGPISSEKLILFRMYGAMIDRTGGTAAGMSGSPLYINGRLIGAHSAGFTWQTPQRDIALATPIEDMMKVLNNRSQRAGAVEYKTSRPMTAGGKTFDRVFVAQTPGQARQLVAQRPDTPVAIPSVVTYAIGLSPRAARLFAQSIQPLGLEVLQGHAGRGDFDAAAIVPGSSVGVEEVRGDVEFGGICTVTTRIGDRILVCGHPWENRGDVEYILTASEILTVVKSLQRSFKVGNIGRVIGIIDQDRGTAISGRLGTLPRLFNVRVVVTDTDAGTRLALGAQMVRRRDLARALAPLVALSAVERARNQSGGEGTAIVKLTLRAKGLPGPIVRENMFHSSHDIAIASVLDVVDAMELAFYNDLRRLEPYDLTVEVSLTKRRVTASIVDLAVASREVNAGGVLRVRVRLQPYLADATVTRVMEVPIPRDFPRGPAVVVVRSAGVDAQGTPPEVVLGNLMQSEPVPWGVASLDDALRLFSQFGRNTDLLVRVVPFGLPATQQDFTLFDVQAGQTLRTDWVIQGSERVPIVVR
jgi:hypothetical protein